MNKKTMSLARSATTAGKHRTSGLAWILAAMIMTTGALQAQVPPSLQLTSGGYDLEPVWSPDGQKIVFVSLRRSESWNIWVMDADGSNLIQLTNNKSDDSFPQWSPDGKQIAFSRIRKKYEDIWTMDADGRNQTRLLKRKGSNTDLFWSANGRSLVYLKEVKDLSEIWRTNASYKDESSVVTWSNMYDANRELGLLNGFSLSRTGGKIALELLFFPRDDNGLRQFDPNEEPKNRITLWQNGTAQILTAAESDEWAPSWSHDGGKLAFVSSVNGIAQIWTMDATGQNRRQVTYSNSDNYMPNWSPDGKKITFINDDSDGVPGIWVLDMAGGTPSPVAATADLPKSSPRAPSGVVAALPKGPARMISQNYDNSLAPFWSPDGMKIVYSSFRGNNDGYHLWEMDPEGGNLKQLTFDNSTDFDPQWSPNGKRIIFSRRRIVQDYDDIWVMNANGSNPMLFLKDKKIDDYAWSPNGQSLYFLKNLPNGHEIWGINISTSKESALVRQADIRRTGRDPKLLTRFRLSPDGGGIIMHFEKSFGRAGEVQAEIVRWQNGTAQTIAMYESADGSGILSPDGKMLAFISGLEYDNDGNVIDFETGQILITDAMGQNPQQITTVASYKTGLRWSPDSKAIAFTAGYFAMGESNIWLVDVPNDMPPTLAGITPAPARMPSSPEQTIVRPSVESAGRNTPRATHLRTDNLNIAVVQFQEKGRLDQPDAGGMIAELMSTALDATGAFELFERVLLQDVLAEQNIGLTGALDDKTTAEIGKIYGVDAIVTGTIFKFGNTFNITARLVDTKTAKFIASGKVSAKDLDSIAIELGQLAIKLATIRETE